jgi:thiamine-monophosphate kinase
MGARPLGVVAALAAPPELPAARADGLVRGLLDGARRWGAPLVGGNVARARDTVLTLTAVGAVARGRALTRDAARPGDRICVTGRFGASALAIARARRGGGAGAARVRLAPEPRLHAGRVLARTVGIGACIDVSDGIVADLGHVLRASRVGASIEPARVPVPPGFARACARAGADPVRLALAGGEDYELLFTVRPDGPRPARLAARLGVAVAEIGMVTRGRGLRGVPARVAGFTHF